MSYGFDNWGHISKSEAFLLFEGILLSLTPCYKICNVNLHEARHMRCNLYGLYHAVSNDATDWIHWDNLIICPNRYGRSCDLRTGRLWCYHARGSLYTWRRCWCSLLLFNIANNISLAYTSPKACTLYAI